MATMTPEEVLNIARLYDEFTITGNRGDDGAYNSVMLSFVEGQSVFVRVGETVTVFVFGAPTGTAHTRYSGDDPLWLAATLALIKSDSTQPGVKLT